MFKVILKNLSWVIQHSNGELLHECKKLGWQGLKSDLPEIKDKRIAVNPVMFGYYNKAQAVILCEKLNKEGENYGTNFN